MNYTLLNKIILFTVDTYIDRMKEDKLELPEILDRVKIGLVSYKRSNLFTKEEAEVAMKLGKDENLQKIVHTEISHVLFILTIIKLWVELVPKRERPFLNISDRKLKQGKAIYAIYMLKEKQINKENYEEKKQIIDTSVLTAEQFMSYHFEILNKIK